MTDVEDLAADLTARGYRRISNGARRISRIDRPDWVDVLARKLLRSPADFYVLGELRPDGSWCDHYRRCYSKDVRVVPTDVYMKIPGSGHDDCGYVPPFSRGSDTALLTAAKAVLKHVRFYDWPTEINGHDLAKLACAVEALEGD